MSEDQKPEVMTEADAFSDGLGQGIASAFGSLTVLVFPPLSQADNRRVAFPFSINRMAVGTLGFQIDNCILNLNIMLLQGGETSWGVCDVSGIPHKDVATLSAKLLQLIYSNTAKIVVSDVLAEILAEVRGK